MADKRKLQGEIDRCLKKVTEGVDIFEDLWQKIYSTTNVNIKEKHEADLKKEIKKLQRLRDAIKTWLTTPEVKDKKNLLEYKKLIETQMERFKVVERETKTKAFSKEGLGLQVKMDPKEKEKEDVVIWLSQSIDTLNVQVDQCECEIEVISAKKKKNDRDKQDQIDSFRVSLERRKHHIGRLELIMRLLDNDALAVDQIQRIKEEVDYYISSNNDCSFDENEFIYEELNLDEISASLGKTQMDSLISGDDDLSVNFNLSDTTSLPSSSCPSPTPSNLSHHNVCNQHKDDNLKEKRKSHSEDFHITEKLTSHCNNKPQHSTSSNNLINKSTPFSARSHNDLPQPPIQPVISMVTTGQNYAQVASLRVNNIGNNEPKSKNHLTTSSSSSSSSPRFKQHKHHNNNTAQQQQQQQQLKQQFNHHNDNHKKNKNVAENIISSMKNFNSKNKSLRTSNRSPVLLLLTTTTTATNTTTTNSTTSTTTTTTTTTTSPTTATTTTTAHIMNCIDEITNDFKLNSDPYSNSILINNTNAKPDTTSLSNNVTSCYNTTSNVTTNTTATKTKPNLYISTNYNSDIIDGNFSKPSDTSSSTNATSSAIITTTTITTTATTTTTLDNVTPQGGGASSTLTTLTTATTIVENINQQMSTTSSTPIPLRNPAFNNHTTKHTSLFLPMPPTQPTLNANSTMARTTTTTSTTTSTPASQNSTSTTTNHNNATTTTSTFFNLSSLTNNNLTMSSMMMMATTSTTTPHNNNTSPTTTTTIKINPIYSLTPLGRVPLIKPHMFQMKMLTSASTHMPTIMDSHHIRSTNLPMPYKMPSYYTPLPPSIYNNIDFYLKLNPETLFFIFYYMEGSKAQYMAAKALKQLSWRFHTRYLMWFQRRDEPTLITEDCEQGSYIYFDYERWAQRNVDTFTFEYKYLEDKDLS